MSVNRITYGFGLILCLLAGCDDGKQPAAPASELPAPPKPTAGQVDTARLLAADSEPHQWLSAGRDFKQQHFSPLDQINTNNVDQLGFAWEYPITHPGRVKHHLEATPQVIDGVMYTSGPWSIVFAVDAKTGREIWRYRPNVDGNYARRGCCGVVNRGVAVWRGKVYIATFDGYLVALDAATGRQQWKVDTLVDRLPFYSITGAPWIAGDKVVIGNSGAEMGVRGYISAYDVETGEFAWRFYTVPGDPAKGYEHPELEEAAKTWSPDSDWASGGGGTAWGHMAYDPELNLLYVGTGNGSPWPVWHRSPGGGDNLFLSSILAINPDTGRLVWYYQTTPGDSWDYTATQHMILAELEIDGKKRKVLMQAPKNGFFYVLDRVTGELLSANKFAEITWATHVNMKTGRPVLTEQANYQNTPKAISPAPGGAHNWQPMSFNPRAALVYIPVRISKALYVNHRGYRYNTKGHSEGASELYPPFAEAYSEYEKYFADGERRLQLTAWDPIAQQAVWKAPLKDHGSGGVLSTAGNLVIQGTMTGYLYVYNARTGEKLKTINIGTGIMAAPMSFSIDGEQYVAVMAGGFSEKYQRGGRLIALRLGGGETPLPPPALKLPVPEPPPLRGTVEQRQQGRALYEKYCGKCHVAGTDYYPDLTALPESIHPLFNKIVLEGLFRGGGMASFADTLTGNDVEAIHTYLIAEQHKRKAAIKNTGKSQPPASH